MHPLYEEFLEYLEQEDRMKCVQLVLSKLSNNEIDVITLYNEVLAPALNNMVCEEPEETCIWKEHVKSSIVRTVVENCYPYVIKERKDKFGERAGDKVIVICPPEELHEIGPRMVADFFTLCGYDVTFVGANTPRASFLSAIRHTRPRYVAISVSNYYNILATKRTIESIREASSGEVEIIVGGKAFENNPEAFREIGADRVMGTLDEIKKLQGGG